MSNAGWALQQAVYAAVTDDATLNGLLGGASIYDDVPERAAFPFVTFAAGSERDWSTDAEAGTEHALALHAWSRAGGRKEALAILAAVRAVLHDAALTLDGHRLVNLRHETSDVRRSSDGETWQGIARFRAVTEVNGE
jgi:hypothetical protein